jgi:uncharacterized membrane protein YfcA
MPNEAAYLLLVVAGLAAGFLNTLAGGGSLLTLPALIFIGLDANLANGTNRVAVLLQNAMAVASFAHHRRLPGRRALTLIPAVLLGAWAGARVAVDVPAPILKSLLAAVLLLALPSVFLPEGRRARSAAPDRARRRAAPDRRLWLHAVFLGIGFYGGFIQAGVGFLILGALVPLAGLDLVNANAIKVVLVLAYTAMAMPVFLAHGQVDLTAGLVLAVGNVTGAWLGSRFAVRRGARFVRWVLVAALLLSAVQLLGIPARVAGWFHG